MGVMYTCLSPSLENLSQRASRLTQRILPSNYFSSLSFLSSPTCLLHLGHPTPDTLPEGLSPPPPPPYNVNCVPGRIRLSLQESLLPLKALILSTHSQFPGPQPLLSSWSPMYAFPAGSTGLLHRPQTQGVLSQVEATAPISSVLLWVYLCPVTSFKGKLKFHLL